MLASLVTDSWLLLKHGYSNSDSFQANTRCCFSNKVTSLVFTLYDAKSNLNVTRSNEEQCVTKLVNHLTSEASQVKFYRLYMQYRQGFDYELVSIIKVWCGTGCVQLLSLLFQT